VETLAARREKIGRTYFSKVLALDDFRVNNGELLFDDLAVKYKYASARNTTWRGANSTMRAEPSNRCRGKHHSVCRGDLLPLRHRAMLPQQFALQRTAEKNITVY